ncbi:hypothetical protein ALC57_01789, partial [Trachymyrmex cornetzi]
VKTRYGEGRGNSHSSLWKSRNEQRYSDLTVRHGRHWGSYFPAEMSSTRLRGWFVVGKHDGKIRGVAEKDEKLQKSAFSSRVRACNNGR